MSLSSLFLSPSLLLPLRFQSSPLQKQDLVDPAASLGIFPVSSIVQFSQLNVHLCWCLIDSTCSLFTLHSNFSVHCHVKSVLFPWNILLYLFVSDSFYFFLRFRFLLSYTQVVLKMEVGFCPQGRLATPRDIFGYYSGIGVPLTLTKKRSRMRLNIVRTQDGPCNRGPSSSDCQYCPGWEILP